MSLGRAEEYDPTTPYCGPGELTLRANDEVNRLCYAHDNEYGKISKRGGNPYIVYNDADEKFLEGLAKASKLGFTGGLAEQFFLGKKLLTGPYAMGPALSNNNPNPKKRKTDQVTYYDHKYRAKRLESAEKNYGSVWTAGYSDLNRRIFGRKRAKIPRAFFDNNYVPVYRSITKPYLKRSFRKRRRARRY